MRKEYSVRLLCIVLKVSPSGYYAYLKREKRQAPNGDRKLLTRIKRLFTLHKGTMGAKRIAKKLSQKGTPANHKRVARLMREANLKAKVRIPKSTPVTRSDASGYVYDNLLERNFDSSMPNQKWVTDMTEIIIDDNKLYASALMDLFNREILAFEISDSPNTALIYETIKSAQRKRKLPNLEGIIIHSDQGSVYRSNDYHHLSTELKFTPSMSRKANCWDNAVIESFFSHLKVEYPLFYPQMTLNSCKRDLLGYIRYFNERRIQKKLGYITPKNYMTSYKSAV